jgi:hypothetical protein
MQDGFHDFFLAAAGVAGALIGLLFVAISVAPERLLGPSTTQAQRVRASTALTAFTNALSVSLFALIPGIGIGDTASVVAVVGILFVLGSLISLRRMRTVEPAALRDARFLAGVAVLFVVQLLFGVRLLVNDNYTGALRGICVIVVVCFFVGISRSWELIGGPNIGFIHEVATMVRGEDEADDADPPPA